MRRRRSRRCRLGTLDALPRRPSRVLIPRRAPRKRGVEILEEEDAARGDARHEVLEGRVGDPGGGEGDDVDVEHELAGYGVDERALARAGHAVQEVAPAERNAAVGVPLNGRKGCVSSWFSSSFDTGEQGGQSIRAHLRTVFICDGTQARRVSVALDVYVTRADS